jgi:predicted PP-loop superfamily ATPase
MEITSFVLGMLTIVATFISMSIVVGLTKINKLNKQLNNLSNDYERDLIHIHRMIDEKNQEIWRQFENCGRDVTMVEKTLMNQIDETRRYIDSRIDKLRGEQGSKQILKG